MKLAEHNNADKNSKRQRTNEIIGRVRERVARSATTKRVKAPGDACCSHQQRACERRRCESGRDEIDEASQCYEESDPFKQVRSFAAKKRNCEHCRLHRAEQD